MKRSGGVGVERGNISKRANILESSSDCRDAKSDNNNNNKYYGCNDNKTACALLVNENR